ncbi:MAG: hypothetical protein DUD39_11825 [Coriobacteriaceae bacterium]|nr:MAG: hypothetical protein DUD39_11825 [Coriobacteriaceae bacterium]
MLSQKVWLDETSLSARFCRACRFSKNKICIGATADVHRVTEGGVQQDEPEKDIGYPLEVIAQKNPCSCTISEALGVRCTALRHAAGQ